MEVIISLTFPYGSKNTGKKEKKLKKERKKETVKPREDDITYL